MLLRTFRRWSPFLAHLALLLVFNLVCDGPALAEQVRLRSHLVKLPAELEGRGSWPDEAAIEEALRVLEGLKPLTPDPSPIPSPPPGEGRPRPPLVTKKPIKKLMAAPQGARAYSQGFQPQALGGGAPLPGEGSAMGEGMGVRGPAPVLLASAVPPPPSLPDMPAASMAPLAPQPMAAPAATSSPDQVSLLSGWNLISLPKQPDSVDPSTVLASISGSYNVAHAYDACSSDPWRTYDPGAPAESSLTAIDHRMGVWVRATAAATLAVSGTEPAETTIQLCQGWNLIGYPLAQPRPVLAALSSIAGRFQRVYGWDPADTADPWEVFDVAVPAWANDLEQMQPGRGYWIYATADTTLVMSNAGLPPEVAITSPANAAVVTAPTDVIGTVKSDLLEQWTLAYRLKGETGAFTTFATGNTPVTNGVLGKFDPTLLLNGLYEIELTATDFQGQSVSISIDVAVEGNLKIGHFTLSFVDLEVPLAGLPIQVIRTYDSRDKRLGDFGIGWRVRVSNVRLQEDGPVGERWQGVRSGGTFSNYCVFPTREHQVTITLPDDRVLRFRPKLTPECQLFAPSQVVNISYVPLPGTLGSLEMLDQNPQALVVGSFLGTVQLWDQDGVELEDPGRYRLTMQDGRRFVIDQAAGLVNLTDLNGNTLTFGRNGITHSSGEGVTFERDTQGKITRITDPAGESLTYSYDTAADLVAVTDREKATTRFIYDDHYLLSIQDPLGRQPIRNEYDASGRLTSTTDAFGKKINLTHSLAANQEVITDRLGHSRVLEYDVRGNVIRETDALGKVTTRTFDGNDQLLSETDPLGHTTRYTYDASRNLTEVEDQLGHSIRYTYNVHRQVLTTTDPLGNTRHNTYDGSGNLLESEDPLGNATSYTYDSRGNLLSQTDAEGAITRFEYDAQGNVVREIDAAGIETTSTYDRNGNRLTQTTTRTTAAGIETLTWRYTYDRIGRLTARRDPDGTVSRTEYNVLGNVAATIDKLGRRTSFTYDEAGQPTRTDYPDGTFTLSGYDAEGRLVASTDQAGRTTSYTYDLAGRLVRTTFPDGASAARIYDDAGRLVEEWDPRGNPTHYSYDAAGSRTLITDALSNQTIFGYDAAGNQISVKDVRGHTTAFEYDAAGRLVRTLYADGTDAEVEYDGLGRRVAETDQAGLTTRFGYDALGRLTTVTDALGQVTRYAYDEQGNRISQIDANGHEARFEYDSVGRQTRRVLPGGASETFAYDAAGNLDHKKTFGGVIIQYAYDAAGHLLSRTFPGGSAAFTYTPTGRRKTAVDARGTTLYEYDSRDQLLRLVYPDGRQLRYVWDAAGNRIGLTALVGGATATTAFTYDALNRLEAVRDSAGQVYTYTYDPNGNRASIEYPNGITTRYTYDQINRLTELTTMRERDNAVVQRQAYTLGPSGNRIRVEEANADGSGIRSYGYDDLYRLTSETVSSTAGEIYRKAFGYDPVGNRLTQEHREASGVAFNKAYTYDTRDRLLTEDGTINMWDVDGRLATKSSTASYSWDPEDRLTQVTLVDGTVIRYAYDADGVRVRTEVTSPSGATTVTEYLVDTSRPLSQVVAEGSTLTEVAVLYVRGNDDLFAAVRGSVTRFYHADGSGSIQVLTDEAGEVTDRYAFTAFGELIEHRGNDPNIYLFTGEPRDPGSGLYYLRARWMSPGEGRFISLDPLLGSHGYAYAHQNPVNLRDRTGLFIDIGIATLALAFIGPLNLLRILQNKPRQLEVIPVLLPGAGDDLEGWSQTEISDANSVLQPQTNILITAGTPIPRDPFQGKSYPPSITDGAMEAVAVFNAKHLKRNSIPVLFAPTTDVFEAGGITDRGRTFCSVDDGSSGGWGISINRAAIEATKATPRGRGFHVLAHELVHALGCLREAAGPDRLMNQNLPGSQLTKQEIEWIQYNFDRFVRGEKQIEAGSDPKQGPP